MVIRGGTTHAVYSFADEVREGLGQAGQKMLPSKYLYDDVGSALFEVITKLPEYGLTRAEERILLGNSETIAGRLAAPGWWSNSAVVVAGKRAGYWKPSRIITRPRTVPSRSHRPRWRVANANSTTWPT